MCTRSSHWVHTKVEWRFFFWRFAVSFCALVCECAMACDVVFFWGGLWTSFLIHFCYFVCVMLLLGHLLFYITLITGFMVGRRHRCRCSCCYCRCHYRGCTRLCQQKTISLFLGICRFLKCEYWLCAFLFYLISLSCPLLLLLWCSCCCCLMLL